jgi:hypothetical protein
MASQELNRSEVCFVNSSLIPLEFNGIIQLADFDLWNVRRIGEECSDLEVVTYSSSSLVSSDKPLSFSSSFTLGTNPVAAGQDANEWWEIEAASSSIVDIDSRSTSESLFWEQIPVSYQISFMKEEFYFSGLRLQ